MTKKQKKTLTEKQKKSLQVQFSAMQVIMSANKLLQLCLFPAKI